MGHISSIRRQVSINPGEGGKMLAALEVGFSKVPFQSEIASSAGMPD